jgi:hypothetical protein
VDEVTLLDQVALRAVQPATAHASAPNAKPRLGKVAGRSSNRSIAVAQASRTIAGPQESGKNPPFAAPSPATAPNAMTPLRTPAIVSGLAEVLRRGSDAP